MSIDSRITPAMQKHLRATGLLAGADEPWTHPSSNFRLDRSLSFERQRPRIGAGEADPPAHAPVAVGNAYDDWQVIGEAEKGRRGTTRFLCRCTTCGNECVIPGQKLARRQYASCSDCRAALAA